MTTKLSDLSHRTLFDTSSPWFGKTQLNSIPILASATINLSLYFRVREANLACTFYQNEHVTVDNGASKNNTIKQLPAQGTNQLVDDVARVSINGSRWVLVRLGADWMQLEEIKTLN